MAAPEVLQPLRHSLGYAPSPVGVPTVPKVAEEHAVEEHVAPPPGSLLPRSPCVEDVLRHGLSRLGHCDLEGSRHARQGATRVRQVGLE
eukprot:6921365-Alexandrium_andersonii.AAC.1